MTNVFPLSMYAVVMHEERTHRVLDFVELRPWRHPEMLLPYPCLRLETAIEARMWNEIENPDVTLTWAKQEGHWDDSTKQMVYGDVIDLHLVEFPKYCSDPFWQQFANPLMAYSGHGLAYQYYLTNRLPKPTGTDHTDFFAAMAMRAHEKFDGMPHVKEILKQFNATFKENSK